jgi:hypothetical protein
MRQDRDRGDNARSRASVSAMLLRAACGAAFVGLVVGVGTSAAWAQTYGGDSGTAFSSFMKMFGMNKSPEDTINYTERSPLVVPPSRDLPPPVAGAPPVQDWPKDPAGSPKHAKGKPAVVPATAVQTPNPPVEKKPWYNPIGWFNKEEYANFTGEPVRNNLTDPPAGYRVPSPDQPYGIAPEKKSGKTQASATDFNLSSVTPPATGH